MIVTVIDREAMNKELGFGFFTILTKTVTISNKCPICGGDRGKPYPYHHYEDGDSAIVSRWDNPCGHIDKYTDVIKEGKLPCDQ